jgi:hypothetical protein
MGKIRCTIAPRNLPKAWIFPVMGEGWSHSGV